MTAASLLYFAALALWSAFVAYSIIKVLPKQKAHTTSPTVYQDHHPVPPHYTPQTGPEGFNPYEGFKSFAKDGNLTVEDIVKSLSRKN